jgi:5-methylcytosine-specific restriction endonuclease McrA
MPAKSAHEHEKPGLECGVRAERTQEEPAPGGGDEQPETPIEQVNRLYQAYRHRERSKKRDAATTIERTGTSRSAEQRERTGKQGRTGIIPPALRKKVMLRDRGRCPPCGGRRVPGCGRVHYGEVHHMKPRGVYGEHVLEDVLVLCSRCHENVHDGRLVIERALSPHGGQAGGLIFRRL